MCVAFPMKIVEVRDSGHGTASCGGVIREVNTRLLKDCRIGDFVLVHAGYAIEKVTPDTAETMLEYFREIDDQKTDK